MAKESTEKKELKVKTEDFFDFPDFFKDVSDKIPMSNEDIFVFLTEYLYVDANHKVKSPKDDVSDILNKKKSFHKKVREYATIDQIGSICKDNSFCSIFDQINNPHALCDKLLFRVKYENYFFEKADYDTLCEHKNDLKFVIAYILIKTIHTSAESKNIRHPDDYNIFKKYHFSENIIEEKTKSPVSEDLAELSQYLNKKYNLLTIEKNLLSNGDHIDALRDEFFINNSFSIVSTSSESTRPLEEFFDTNEHMIIMGEGGIGKTTALFSYMEKHLKNAISKHSIPIYVRLSDCTTNTDHEHMILNYIMNSLGFAISGKCMESFRDLIDEFSLDDNSNEPAYTLLLDGFNEITPMDMGEVRYSIAEEINSFLQYKNVRIILTTRESFMYGIDEHCFTIIKATGIKQEEVKSYLESNYSGYNLNDVLADQSLIQCLQIPLFLKMFTYTENRSHKLPETRGEILFNYYNGMAFLYTEKSHATSKTDKEKNIIINLALDYFLPQLGFSMHEDDRFNFSFDSFDKTLGYIKKVFTFFLNEKPETLQNLNTHVCTANKAVRIFNETDSKDLLLILSDELGILYKDADDRIYFCHQYVRDYFSALYCVSEIKYLVTVVKQLMAREIDDIAWNYKGWAEDQIKMICEILQADSENAAIDLMVSAIDVFRFYDDEEPNFSLFALSNLINTLSELSNGDLSSYDFSRLDLSHCRLNNKNFHNPYKNTKSSFTNSILSRSTFASEEHEYPVKAWAVSDQGHFIVSIDQNMILKIWDISTLKCITTTKTNKLPQYGEIKFLKYVEYSNTIIAASAETISNRLSCAWSFYVNFHNETVYLPIDPENEHFLFFAYDYPDERLFAISDKSVFYKYNINNEAPCESMPIMPDFTDRISTSLLSPDMINRFPTTSLSEMYLLDTKVLYIESDVFPPYIHTIPGCILNGDVYPEVRITDLSEINQSENILSSGARHINLFLYNLYNFEWHPLQLDITPDEITTLVLEASPNEDIIHTHIAVSEELGLIALHNRNDIFLYDISWNDYTFKRIAAVPHYMDYSINFFYDSDTLYMYDRSTLLKYSLSKKSVIEEIVIGTNSFHDGITCTNDYRILKITGSKCRFRINNLFSLSERNISLDDSCHLAASFADCKDSLYLLYSNGTLIRFYTADLSFQWCYNIGSITNFM